jgi:DNA polymerase-3 subunit delta'
MGHRVQVERLLHAAEAGTLPQAYLFSGPQGVGKSLVARHLAAAALGNEARVMRDQHPDLIWLSVLPEKSEISMEQWRAVEARVQFQALEGERQLIIIDDAEKMSASMANACLKTLEEPPAHTHFILVAHDTDRVLPTIRSRCQQIVFSALAVVDVEAWLLAQNIAPEVAHRAAQLSQGSLSRAQRLGSVEVLAQLDSVVKAVNAGMTPQQVLAQSSALATHAAMPEILDGLALAIREGVACQVSSKGLRCIHAVEQAQTHLSVKGANKELILNELFISLSA